MRSYARPLSDDLIPLDLTGSLDMSLPSFDSSSSGFDWNTFLPILGKTAASTYGSIYATEHPGSQPSTQYTGNVPADPSYHAMQGQADPTAPQSGASDFASVGDWIGAHTGYVMVGGFALLAVFVLMGNRSSGAAQ